MMNLRLPVATAALAAMSLVTACSGTTPSGEAAASGPAKQGGKITYGVAGGGLTQLDPNKVSSASLLPLMNLLYSGLTKYGPDMSIKPDLATTWKSSPDLKTWTFTLRSGVKFNSGREFTATDAVKNIKRVMDPATASQSRGKLKMIDTVTAVNPTTLKITLKTPNAVLPASLPSVKMSDVDDIANVNAHADGTGPYKLKDFVPDDHVTLVRNAGYWGTQGKLDEIDVVTVADTTAAATSLKNGEIDVVWNVPPLDVAPLTSGTDLAVLTPKTQSGAVIWEVDATSAPFNDVHARQALAYALNRQELLGAGYDNRGTAAKANGILNPDQAAYAKDQASYDQDLNKAKELFAQAGVKQGDTLTFWTTSGRNPQWITMAEILQQDLKKIGITLVIQKNEASTWLGKFFPAGKKYPGVIVANYLSLPSDPSQQLNFFKTGVCECNWSNAQYDQLLHQATATADPSARNALYGQLQKILNDQVPVVIPLVTSQLTVINKRLVGAWVQSDGAVHLEEAGLTN
jgi:peptide/nickel transport system substrate-binding protein